MYEHLDSFHSLDFVHDAGVNMDEQVSLEKDMDSFGACTQCGIGRSCDRSIFSVVRNFHADFHGGHSS